MKPASASPSAVFVPLCPPTSKSSTNNPPLCAAPYSTAASSARTVPGAAQANGGTNKPGNATNGTSKSPTASSSDYTASMTPGLSKASMTNHSHSYSYSYSYS